MIMGGVVIGGDSCSRACAFVHLLLLKILYGNGIIFAATQSAKAWN